MYRLVCNNCQSDIPYDKCITREPKRDKHIVLCHSCQKKNVFCSRTECKKLYFLNDEDLVNLRHLYFKNPNNNQKLYYRDDVEKIATDKHGSMEKIDIQHKLSKKRQLLRKQKSDLAKEQRKKDIVEIFVDNKLAFEYNGDCYSYVNYGTPSMESIVENEIKKMNQKNGRRLKLARVLAEKNIPFDEKMPACYNFINDIGCASVESVVEAVEIEHFFKCCTDYETLLKKGQIDQSARNIALNRYMRSDKKQEKVPVKLKKRMTVHFD